MSGAANHPDPLAKELEGQAAKFREQIGRYGNLTMPQTFNRLDELTAEIARLQSELAALKKPVEEGEIAGCIEKLEHNAFTLDHDAALDVSDMVRNMALAADFLRRLSADKARMEEALRKIASHETDDEMDPEIVSEADFQGGFTGIILMARSALPKQKETL